MEDDIVRMKTEPKITWACDNCGDTFRSDWSRHSPDTCECGMAFVDHEKEYVRRNAAATRIDE